MPWVAAHVERQLRDVPTCMGGIRVDRASALAETKRVSELFDASLHRYKRSAT